jgi:hypothetical protein
MYTFAKNSHLSRQDVPAFLKELEGADRVHHWVKGIRGVALIDSGNGYSTTIFTKHRRYKHQFEALKANIEASKRHIETAVRQYG